MVNSDQDGILNVGFSVWLFVCIFVCFWLWNNYTQGRRKFQNNLHVIEEGLRKMQADIDMRQREKSIGCMEDVEDISEFLKKFYEEANKKEENAEGTETTEVKGDEKESEMVEEVDDKKTV